MGWTKLYLIRYNCHIQLPTGRTVVNRKRTCTADMCIAQNVKLEEKSAPIDRKDIVQALHRRNLLRLTESIQISPNGRFCFIKFSTKQVMETFCTEDLTQSENIEIYFKPDFKSIPKRTFTFILFVNVSQSTGKRYESICQTILYRTRGPLSNAKNRWYKISYRDASLKGLQYQETPPKICSHIWEVDQSNIWRSTSMTKTRRWHSTTNWTNGTRSWSNWSTATKEPNKN